MRGCAWGAYIKGRYGSNWSPDFMGCKLSVEWADRVVEPLAADRKGSKARLLWPLLRHFIRRGTAHTPTEAPLRILRPIWRAHEKRRLEAVLGKDEAEADLSQALPC